MGACMQAETGRYVTLRRSLPDSPSFPNPSHRSFYRLRLASPPPWNDRAWQGPEERGDRACAWDRQIGGEKSGNRFPRTWQIRMRGEAGEQGRWWWWRGSLERSSPSLLDLSNNPPWQMHPIERMLAKQIPPVFSWSSVIVMTTLHSRKWIVKRRKNKETFFFCKAQRFTFGIVQKESEKSNARERGNRRAASRPIDR